MRRRKHGACSGQAVEGDGSSAELAKGYDSIPQALTNPRLTAGSCSRTYKQSARPASEKIATTFSAICDSVGSVGGEVVAMLRHHKRIREKRSGWSADTLSMFGMACPPLQFRPRPRRPTRRRLIDAAARLAGTQQALAPPLAPI